MISRILGAFILWFGNIIVFNIGHLYTFLVLSKIHPIFFIKPYGLIGITCHLESIYTCLVIKYIGHSDKLLIIIGEMPCQLPLGYVDKPVVYFPGKTV